MAVNKVVLGNSTLIDLTGDTITADKLAQGITAHDASGAAITGTMASPNCYIAELTLATHSSTNVPLCTLPDEVYAHKDDENFTVSLINTTPSALVANDDYNITSTVNADYPKANGNYTVYGSGRRRVGSSVTTQPLNIYYPPNETTNATGLGGVGKFWINGKVLTYKSASYYLGAGTLRVIVTW